MPPTTLVILMNTTHSNFMPPVGTQIVSTVPIHNSSGTEILTAGAVGVIVSEVETPKHSNRLWLVHAEVPYPPAQAAAKSR